MSPLSRDKVRNYIRKYGVKIRAKELAKWLDIREDGFSKEFKRALNVCFRDWIVEQRIEEAKRLLKKGLSLKCIVDELEYRQISYFSMLFRKKTGKSIREWKMRKSMRWIGRKVS